MEKDAFYFPHFCNARHDRKIKRVIKELGVEGYGIFFMLLEVLRDQTDFSFPIEDIDLLADEFGTSEQKVRTVICNYQLFDIDENQKFFSPKMLVYLQPYFKLKEDRKEAGRLGGLMSAKKRAEKTQALLQAQLEQKQPKESKQSKVKESKDNINDEILYQIETLYNLYPSVCPFREHTTGKRLKDKDKIFNLIKKHGYDHVLKGFNQYIASCHKSKTYFKNFSTFLNFFNDFIQETNQPLKQPVKKYETAEEIAAREAEHIKRIRGER